MDYTRDLVRFCSDLSYDKLPAEATHKAKLCVLDYVANVYGSLELDATRGVIEFVKSLGGPREATALGCGFKTGLQNAAFINGTTAEAIEAQDGLRFGGNHPVCAVVPAALALAESRGRDGKELIAALVAGYEMANRSAAAVHPFHTLSGFLPTGTCGTFGAAIAASRLMGHGFDEMLNAAGIAGYIVPMSMAEQLMGGYTVKIVQGGQAASVGIMAAGLAGKGVTGSPHVLEGTALKGGFTQITVKQEPRPERITDKLGERYSIMDIYFKPYTACRHTHGAAQATMELMKEKKLNAAGIESVTVSTYAISALAVGKGVPDGGSFVSAQFSIPYVVAVCLLDGMLGPGQLTERRIADPTVIALSKKVTVQPDDELNKLYPDKTASRIEILMKSGERLVKQVDIPKGDPRDPMEAGDIAEKVRFFAGNRNRKKTDRVIDAVMELDRAKNVRDLVALI
ncbi:MAG: MmgE/PrpD family protein [Spirochaetes bacterium]|nr:MmgE/PrpD family protein [Spirochaetota bacterium]HOD13817.1 MmgE/PrpD family protein [Spirochaetota bacterium]HPG50154.1 MmgE/PrpD family protein [Spirochaetota bacterium]